ncbi:hypothetical protein BDB00DRAFT_792500 [Zychaea mexicana]|uniref:uncharacterized protein n=1 Tax=Zychaea mexicana TaxID=64656 RepID=UPI0022FE6CD3|nr:uncharacterized protein BDB00DRAFT_792500 [Zychaea mexicana]KAI9484896.1 hypothetical protein BDB00DRAFT_792500 [Zychaea mexicana]
MHLMKSFLPAAASALQSAFLWFAGFLSSPSASSPSASSSSTSSSSIATNKDDNCNQAAFELTAEDLALVLSAAVSVVETTISVDQAAASLQRRSQPQHFCTARLRRSYAYPYCTKCESNGKVMVHIDNQDLSIEVAQLNKVVMNSALTLSILYQL